jgi:UTP--glucose-1-phosphate uridylyltransferase
MAKLKQSADPTAPKEMESIVEKPKPADSPSTLAQLGRFVLSPRVIDLLQELDASDGDELFLTHAIDKLCREARVIVHPIEGKWLTMGDPLPYLIANFEYALQRPALRESVVNYVRSLDLSEL